MKVPVKTRAGLKAFATEHRIKDIAVCPAQKTIYLLAGARTLNSLIGKTRPWGFQVSGYDQIDRTWDGVEYGVQQLLAQAGVPPPTKSQWGWDDWSVVPIPTPGWPKLTCWSAKTGKKLPKKKVSYSLCKEDVRVPAGGYDRPVLLSLDGKDLPPAFVSHGVGFHDFKQVRACGGLLWPSFAVTWKVPPSYGDVIFLADPSLLYSSLKPVGGFDRQKVVFPTDSWSPTGRELLVREQAITHELTGNLKWWSGSLDREQGGWGQRGLQDHLLYGSTDPDDLRGGFAPDAAWDPLKTMPAFWRRFAHLVKAHTKATGSVYGYVSREELRDALDEDDVYSYMEIKVRGVVEIDTLTACLYPRNKKRRVYTFLDAMGYKGWRIPFTCPGPCPTSDKATDADRAVWAMAATQALLEWSGDPCSYRGAWVPPDLRARGPGEHDPPFWSPMSDRYPYQPAARWSKQRNHGYGGHVGWRRGYCPPGP